MKIKSPSLRGGKIFEPVESKNIFELLKLLTAANAICECSWFPACTLKWQKSCKRKAPQANFKMLQRLKMCLERKTGEAAWSGFFLVARKRKNILSCWLVDSAKWVFTSSVMDRDIFRNKQKNFCVSERSEQKVFAFNPKDSKTKHSSTKLNRKFEQRGMRSSRCEKETTD